MTVINLPDKCIIDLRSSLLAVQDKLIEVGSYVISDTAMLKIMVSLLECALGNATTDNLRIAAKEINDVLKEECVPVLPEDMASILYEGISELENNCLHMLRDHFDLEPDGYNLVVDPYLKRVTISAFDKVYDVRPLHMTTHIDYHAQQSYSSNFNNARDVIIRDLALGNEVSNEILKYFNI